MSFTLRITTVSTELVYSGWLKLTRYVLDIERRDGRKVRAVREVHDHGHAASVLPYDPKRDTVLLVRQFRLPLLLQGLSGMFIEACAGLLDGDEPQAAARREAEEELGYRVRNLSSLGRVWVTPGAVTESVWLFTAEYDPSDKISDGGGSDADEDVEVLEFELDAAMRMISTGEVADAKTIILLQHLWMARKETGK